MLSLFITNLRQLNIIGYREAFEFSDKVSIIIKLATNNLYSYRNIKKNSYLLLLYICYIIRQLLLGIKYIYSEDYTQYNLKPQNILITKQNLKINLLTIKLTDFGLISITSNLFLIYNTPGYFAPEIKAEIVRQIYLKQQKATEL